MTKLHAINKLSILAVGALVAGIALVSFSSLNSTKKSAKGAYTETAIFAGGCFWCMEKPFESLDGVGDVVSGYIGGHLENPSYRDVSSGASGHLEAVKIPYNPRLVSYQDLLEVYWRQIDPTDSGGSFVDRGPQYRSAIFYNNEEQQAAALAAKQELDASGFYNKPVVTDIQVASTFYPAEDYHQDYGDNNPVRYHLYRYRSGRDQYLDKQWANGIMPKAVAIKTGNTEQNTMDKSDMGDFKKPTDEELRKRLTDMQFHVTQKEGTEPPFRNEFWDNKKQGIYVDVVSGEPLFSSADKFKSGTGWPSFTKPIGDSNLVEKVDRSLFSTRTELRSPHADSHLGHVFNDGPAPTGKRYCINSASLRFIPKEDLEAEGYGKFVKELGI